MKRSPHKTAFLLVFLLCGFSCTQIDSAAELSRIEEMVSLGKLDEALQRYRILSKQLPDELPSGSIFFRHAELAASVGKEDEAIALYGRVVGLAPLSEAARIARERRADLFERLGRADETIEEYTQLAKYYAHQPQALWYQLKIAEAFLMRGDSRQARLELETLQRMPKLPALIREQILFDIAESYFLDTAQQKAVAAYEALLKRFPQTPYRGEAYLKMSRCFEQLGFLGDAYAIAKLALDSYPERSVVEARLTELEVRGTEISPSTLRPKGRSMLRVDPEHAALNGTLQGADIKRRSRRIKKTEGKRGLQRGGGQLDGSPQ